MTLRERLTTSDRQCVFMAESLGVILARLGMMTNEEIDTILNLFKTYQPLPNDPEMKSFGHMVEALEAMKDGT